MDDLDLDLVYYTNHADAVGVGIDGATWFIAPGGRIMEISHPWRLADDEFPDRLTPEQVSKLRIVAQWRPEPVPAVMLPPRKPTGSGVGRRTAERSLKLRQASPSEIREFLEACGQAGQPTNGSTFNVEWIGD